jgi:phage terminase small subunit
MLDKMRAFASELGLTPAARKRLGKGSKADTKPNPLAGLRVVRNQATP